jgi:hypothetical protein
MKLLVDRNASREVKLSEDLMVSIFRIEKYPSKKAAGVGSRRALSELRDSRLYVAQDHCALKNIVGVRI